MKKRIQKGAIFALTFVVTGWIIYWVWSKITSFTDLVVDYIPWLPGAQHPILKNLLGLAIVGFLSYIIGALPQEWRTNMQNFVKKMPFLKEFYKPISSVFGFFDADNRDFKDVWIVCLENPGQPPYSLGFQTNDQPLLVQGDEIYPIMIPPGAALTGVIKWFPKDRLIACDMTVKEAMATLLTVGSNYSDKNNIINEQKIPPKK